MEELGQRYMADPGLADELLQELLAAGTDPAIDQAWLNCHWDSDTAINMLIDIADFWDRQPEPLLDFMQACWRRNDTSWHHFIRIDTLDDDPALASAIYRRFADEGPTDDVVASMLFLRMTPDSDLYATRIMAPLLCRGMIENPCVGLLKLWRRYAVSDGLDRGAMRALRRLLMDPATASSAVNVVQILRVRDCVPMLEQLAVLASANLQPATRRARGVLTGISGGRYAGEVARAVCKLPWHPYAASLHYTAHFRMLDYLRDERAMNVMIRLFNTQANQALAEGVFTRIMEMDPDYFERVQLKCARNCYPRDVHSAVYCMYVRGTPPDGRLFCQALREHPLAVECIARRAPGIHREVTWTRRKLLLCCLSEGHAGPKAAKAAKGRGVLNTLARHSCAWPGVLGFL